MRQIEFLSLRNARKRLISTALSAQEWKKTWIIFMLMIWLLLLCETNNFSCLYKGFKSLFGVKVNLFSKRWIGHNFWRLASCNKDTSRQLGTLHFNYASIFQQGFTISVLVCSRNVLTFLGELWPCFAKCALILKGEFWTLHSVCAD